MYLNQKLISIMLTFKVLNPVNFQHLFPGYRFYCSDLFQHIVIKDPAARYSGSFDDLFPDHFQVFEKYIICFLCLPGILDL